MKTTFLMLFFSFSHAISGEVSIQYDQSICRVFRADIYDGLGIIHSDWNAFLKCQNLWALLV